MLRRGKYIALKTFIRKQIEVKVSVNKDAQGQKVKDRFGWPVALCCQVTPAHSWLS